MIEFSTISLRARLLSALVLMLLPLVVLGIGALQLEHSIEDVETVVQDTRDQLVPVQQLRYTINRTVFFGERFLLEGDIEAGENYFALELETDRAYRELRGRFPLSRELDRGIGTSWARWRDAVEAANAVITAPDLAEPGDREARIRTWREFIDAASEILSEETLLILDRTKDRARASHGEAEELVGRVRVLIATSAIIAIAVALLLRRSVLVPLGALRQGARTLGEGDLGHRVGSGFPSEFRDLSRAFNAMAERLENLTIRDELTRLFNRREMNRRLDEEVVRAHRYHHPLSLLMMDIDHFKSVNDRHGHQAGDLVLRQVAERIREAVRPTDWVARYGGEELSAILPETDRESAAAVAERIRADIEASPFPIGEGPGLAVSISIGVATLPDHGSDAHGLIAKADQAVYRAKAAGRNRVRVSG